MSFSFSYYSWKTSSILARIVLGTIVISVLFIFATKEILKPAHYRKPPKGKQWRLPPGPRGIPIFGNLLQYKTARDDEVRWVTYVGVLPVTDETYLSALALKSCLIWRDDDLAYGLKNLGLPE